MSKNNKLDSFKFQNNGGTINDLMNVEVSHNSNSLTANTSHIKLDPHFSLNNENNLISIEYIKAQIENIRNVLEQINTNFTKYEKNSLKASLKNVKMMLQLLKDYVKNNKLNLDSHISSNIAELDSYISFLKARDTHNNLKRGGKKTKKNKKYNRNKRLSKSKKRSKNKKC